LYGIPILKAKSFHTALTKTQGHGF